MCGIAGIVDHAGRLGPERLREIAVAMRDTMTHRGPDDAGVWIDPTGTCALAHRRLSIIDLSPTGRQPMVVPSGAAAITFNGEIYNYKELRRTLVALGARFSTETDTEVLLQSLAGFDTRALASLEGMYAFGLWDAPTRKLLLARDPFGKKPLYVAQGPGWLAFASELRAMRHVPSFAGRIDPEAVHEYLLLQYVHAPRSIYADCEKVPPGTWWILDFSARTGTAPVRTEGRHFSFDAADGQAGADDPRRTRRSWPVSRAGLDAAADALKTVLLEAVSARLRSDVPLGAFLSGGIDSALVVAMVTRELGMPIRSFSIGFEGFAGSEHTQARQAAELLGTEHHEKILAPHAVELLPTIASALDEPLGDSSCLPTHLLSEFTRSHVTVALSGDGGDELFGGYSRYQATLREHADLWMRLKHRLRRGRWWSPGEAYCSHRWLMFPPSELRGLVARKDVGHVEEMVAGWLRALDDPRTPLVRRMQRLDVATYLPGAVLAKVDRMSMAFALEVRCPLLSRAVARFAEDLPAGLCYRDGTTKVILRHLAGRYLPREYVLRPKIGFGLPSGAWSQADMIALADRLLLGADSRTEELLDRAALAAFIERQRQPGGFSIFQIWTLLMLEHWLRAQDGAVSRQVA